MIYLILSSAFIDKEDISKGHESILKIGYTGEDSRKSRFDMYITENPTSKILYLIEEGTEIDEMNLHNYFKHLKKNYGREWFEYDEEILNFFETHTTKESLEGLEINLSKNRQEKIRREVLSDNKKIIQLNYVVLNIIKVYFPDSKRDIVESNKLYGRLLNELSGNFYNLRSYLSKNYPEVEYIEEINIPEDVNFHLDKLYSFKYLSEKLKYLCSLEESMANSLLPHLPESFVNYYTVLGPDKMRALRFNTTDMRKAYEGIIGNQEIDIKAAIIKEFEIDKTYSKADVKKKLGNLYKKLGYSKTPKAVDLGDYFIIKTVDIKNEETGKRDKGYRIVSIKS